MEYISLVSEEYGNLLAFRGDGSAPEIVFKEGFQTKGDNTDVPKYVFQNAESAWVGTSKSPQSALRFAASAASENIKSEAGETGFLYSVRVKDGTDVNVKLGHDQYFKHEHEVLAHNGIPRHDILGAVEVDEFGQPTGEFIPNTEYKHD